MYKHKNRNMTNVLYWIEVRLSSKHLFVKNVCYDSWQTVNQNNCDCSVHTSEMKVGEVKWRSMIHDIMKKGWIEAKVNKFDKLSINYVYICELIWENYYRKPKYTLNSKRIFRVWWWYWKKIRFVVNSKVFVSVHFQLTFKMASD